MSEQARLRTARDMGALEAALSSAGISLGGETNPVMLEFRSVTKRTVLYRNVICWDVQYCTVLYCTVLYCTVLYCTVL